jgi:tetratricopeptide (TPR) repeat protein
MFALARRSRSRVLGVVLAFVVPIVALVPVVAFGEPKPKPAAKPVQEKSEKNDPDNIVAISQYMELVVKGNERYVAKDYTNATDAFRKAIQLSPKNALAHYLLAEAYLGTGNLGEAEPEILLAQENADARNPVLRARVLFVVADLFERQKKWEQAKTAWQAYAEQAAKFSGDGGTFPQSSAERLKAIQKVLEMEKAYAGVRERIAADKFDAGKPAPKK